MAKQNVKYVALQILTLCLCLVVLVACGDSQPRLNRIPADAVIVAFGDSLTYGTGARSDQSYPAQLEKLVRRKVVNAGVPGEVSSNGVKRLPQVLEEHSPALLILCHGGNDLLRKQSKDKLARNLTEMINIARQRNIQVVLLGVPEPALFLLESAPLYPELAGKLKLPIESNILAEVVGDRALKSDHIHPNAEGYRKMADAIHQLLMKTGAIGA